MPVYKREFWTNEEIEKFKRYYPIYTNERLLLEVFPNRTRVALINMSMLLKIKKIKATPSFWTKEELLEKLSSKYKEMGFTPVSTDLGLYGLPSEKTFRRYFSSYRKACALAGIDVNISIFGKSIAGISEKGDICSSKAELFITNFFIKHNITYKKEIKYKNIYGFSYEGNKSCDWYFPNESILVEYFGLPEKESYNRSMQEKINLCKNANMVLIELYRKDLKEERLKTIFKNYIIE